jgi:ketosteroid isomerase-like protein
MRGEPSVYRGRKRRAPFPPSPSRVARLSAAVTLPALLSATPASPPPELSGWRRAAPRPRAARGLGAARRHPDSSGGGDAGVADSNAGSVTAADSRATRDGDGGKGARRFASTIDGWLAAHNTRNLTQVTNFYMPNVSTFYLAQNTTRAAVRAEKARLFQAPAMTLRRMSDPQITFEQDGARATTIFRKSYSRSEASQSQGGEVLQEIVWQKTNRGWKIISERDIRVLR